MGKAKKKRSLRGLVLTGFFFFTLVPLGILAFVVQNQYQKSINQQIKDRLAVHVRELESLFAKKRSNLESFLEKSLLDKSVIYYLSIVDANGLKAALVDKIQQFDQEEVLVFSQSGQVLTFFKEDFQEPAKKLNLPAEIRSDLEDKSVHHRVLFQKNANNESLLTLSIVRKIVGVQDRTVGYIESILSIDQKYLSEITRAIGAEVVFFDGKGKILLGSLPAATNNLNLGKQFLRGKNTFFEFSIEGTPYGFMSTAIRWGQYAFLIGMGSSKSEAAASIGNVRSVIIFTFFSLILFIVALSFYFLREVISPIEALIKASKELKEGRTVNRIDTKSKTEIADLVESFNEMAEQISQSDQKMKKQLDLLEQANNKIKNTQSQLVQSAKLASLGELVAGIAHELNNPIGFIYSNIGHLKEYSRSLFHIIDRSQKNTAELDLLVIEEDYEYIKKDLPKLIQSCEEGANRAKDIVLGLRNFSRADEEKTQAFDVNTGLDSTLKLLSGELKNKIIVRKDYNEVPKINCNINQMKQVFMNILNNAAQAIDGDGKIDIRTSFSSEEKQVCIEIKDDGCGIEKDSLEKIFDPFYTTKSVGEGTGLGLSISYGIVKSHGGSIFVESDIGQGTRFVIELPVYRE